VSRLTIEKVVEQIDQVHRELAQLSIEQIRGVASALTALDILQSHPEPLRPATWQFLKKSMSRAEGAEAGERIERLLFGCMDLTVLEQTASLGDMLNFYVEHGRMHVEGDKIPAVEVVPWLQAEPDFSRREQMQKENSIFLKGIVNPMLLAMLELTVRAVTEKFGFENYVKYSEAKKQVAFDDQAALFKAYLELTQSTYLSRMAPWAESVIGRPFGNLSRYHALYLLRIKDFDEYFPEDVLGPVLQETFQGLGFDLLSRSDVTIDFSKYSAKNPAGICIGVDIPGNVNVLMKPVGGLIDVETLLHEAGHAFHLAHFNGDLPLEYRRLCRSSALDETFAFLFMDLLANRSWLSRVGRLPLDRADRLAELVQTKRLCLIRRYIGKFLAEKELHESGKIKDPEPYCRHLGEATGFVYEPQGYLIDMESDFYALDYLTAWSGANVLTEFLEMRFGTEWFARQGAGSFLKEIAATGRRYSAEQALVKFCGEPPRLPDFSEN